MSYNPDTDVPNDDHGMRAYEVLREVQEAIGSMITGLAAAGFGDITGDALLTLCAMRLSRDARTLVEKIGIDGKVALTSLDILIRCGYLELRKNAKEPRRPEITFTSRGRAALDEADECLKADRWSEFPFRSGDIVISSTPKSGTTWVQMICALLIFQTPELPAELPRLSPWFEASAGKPTHYYAELAAQQHRRFMKTHLPLDRLPDISSVTYIVVARNPLDMAVSWHYQNSKLMTADEHGRPNDQRTPETPRQWILDRVDEMGRSPYGRDSYFDKLLKGLFCAWERRTDPNVVLMNYEDLSADLPGEMHRLADHLKITVSEEKWPSLEQAATFKQMRANADQLRPLGNSLTRDVTKEHAAFFRRGSSGEGRAQLTDTEAARYYSRAARIVPQELLAWLHRDDVA
jgi:aryl sulfotransferase